MKLSIWILSDWLSKYEPYTHIVDGEVELTGARLAFSDTSAFEDGILLVGYSTELLPQVFQERKVLCLHRNDWLCFERDDFVLVFNEILRAFEFYNRWEVSLKELVYAKGSFDELVELCEPVVKNPILIADWKGHVLSVSKNHQPIADNKTWNHWHNDGYLPSYTYERLKQYPEYLEPIIHGDEIQIFEFAQFHYRCIHFGVKYKKETTAYVHIIEDDTKFSQGMLQIASTIRTAVTMLLEQEEIFSKNNQLASLFSDLLSGKQPKLETLTWVSSQLGWDKTRYWYIVIFHSLLKEAFSETAMLELLNKQIRKGCSFSWEKQPIMVIDCDEWNAVSPKIRTLLKHSGFCCGVSMPFNQQNDIPYAFDQARLSIELSSEETVITLCSDCSWRYLVEKLKCQILDTKLFHPAFLVLEEHDRKTGGELARTLYEYLRHDRNLCETADTLFLHRNSLRYRLEKINELTHADLNNPDIRMHIMLSYQIHNEGNVNTKEQYKP